MITAHALSKKERMGIFKALVELQDEGLALVESRQDICRRFGIDLRELMEIEREGLLEQWPPLNDCRP